MSVKDHCPKQQDLSCAYCLFQQQVVMMQEDELHKFQAKLTAARLYKASKGGLSASCVTNSDSGPVEGCFPGSCRL